MDRLIIDSQGASVRKEGERLQVYLEGKKVQDMPLGPLRQVVFMGRGVNASTALLYDLVERGVDVVYQSQHGRFGFRLAGPTSKHSALRVRQVLTLTDPRRALAFARAAVVGKLYNQAVVLHQHAEELGERGQQAQAVLQEQLHEAARAGSLDSLRGHEGSGAAAYFAAWPSLFDAAQWRFAGRAYYPPPDPVNAMLSLGYTLVFNEVVGALHRIGLDPDVGFYHTLEYGRQSLALDLEEEFRPAVVDRLVLRLVRQADLDPAVHFQGGKGGGAQMTNEMRHFFLERYEEQMAVRIGYPPLGHQLSYRQIIEQQAEHLARCLLGRDESYVPLLIR